MQSNNVFVRHPTLGASVLVPFGMFIQPNTQQIGDLTISGFKIVTKENGGLADQAKLSVDDLLVAIDGIFIDDKTLEAVQDLFKTQPPKFSMTLIRQDKDATGDIPKYACLKITIELGVDETDTVIVIFESTETEVLFLYRSSLASPQFSQEIGVTRYMKATSSTTVNMATWTTEPSGPYDWNVNVYRTVTDDASAVTFYTEQFSGTMDGPESEHAVQLDQGFKTSTGSGIICPTTNFFYIKPTGSPQEFAYESVLVEDNYLTSDSDGVSLALEVQTASPGGLPIQSRFLMTNQGRTDMWQSLL